MLSGSSEVPAASRALLPWLTEPAGGLPAPSLAYRAEDSPPVHSFTATAVQAVLAAVGLTHASRVMAPVRCRDAESATVTQLLVPLKDRALPNLPAVLQVAAVIVPVFPLPEASATVVPVPSSKL